MKRHNRCNDIGFWGGFYTTVSISENRIQSFDFAGIIPQSSCHLLRSDPTSMRSCNHVVLLR